jgi:NADH dehydrogenase [ubiquinone] 1 alpha subcomplex assembly factor 5
MIANFNRTSIQLAEQERRGGIANRVSPMISTSILCSHFPIALEVRRRKELISDPTDAPSLLNRAGFTTTTVDVEDLTISYPSIWELMSDLRDMGESNAILGRRNWVSRDVLLAAEAIYKGDPISFD